MATDDSRYHNLFIGKHEMDILAMIGSGITIDGILAAGPWSLNDVTAVVKRHGMHIGDKGKIILPVTVGDQVLNEALASPSPLVRREAARTMAQLMKLRHIQATLAAQEISEGLRRLQQHAVQEWVDWLTSALSAGRAEMTRLRASSPRSARAKRVAS